MQKCKFLTATALSAVAVLPVFVQAQTKPNIIFILSDDHSAPYLGCYGNKDLKTPNLDRLASEGIVYNRAYTTAPQSVPSRAGLMTGRNVLAVEMSRFSAPLKREYITYPELLRQNGYYTGICGRSYHLDGSGAKPAETIEAFKKYNLQTFKDRVDCLRVGSDEGSVKQFKAFLDEVPAGKPFFIQVGFSDPHRDWTADDYNADPKTLTVPPTMPDTKEVREDLAAYYGEIMRMDEKVGQVLAYLKMKGLDKNTIVAFMGDNGAALLRGKGTLYDCGIHVPLIIKWAGVITKGSHTDALFSGEDLGPTFLDAAQVKIPENWTGRSHVPVFKKPESGVRDEVYAVRVAHGSSLPTGSVGFDLGRTVFTKDYKLIYNILWQIPYQPVDFVGGPVWKNLVEKHKKGELEQKWADAFMKPTRPMFELYDLKNDPMEFRNLADDPAYKDILHQYKAKLHEWMIVNSDYAPLPIPPVK